MLRFASFLAAAALMALGCGHANARCWPGCVDYRPTTEFCMCPCAGPATIVVQVPEGAKVSFDDEPTSQTSATRVYWTPPLPVGWDFHYTLKVEGNRGGNGPNETRTITVRAFCTTNVDFTGSQQSPSDLPTLKEVPKLPEAFFPSEEP
jgi:uncharacterized protein (TIGR03000 family)